MPNSRPEAPDNNRWQLRLYVAGQTPKSITALANLRRLCETHLAGRYEIQVLDSYNNPTYFDGQAAAFYGNKPPLVNASRKPGEWQVYDIIFHGPKAGPDGKLVPGSFTVLHNGVLVQDHTPVAGKETTAAMFQGTVPTGPLVLQDHGNRVSYRNIKIRVLKAKAS